MCARGEHCIGPRTTRAGAPRRSGPGAGGVPAVAGDAGAPGAGDDVGAAAAYGAGAGDVAGLVLAEEAPTGAIPARFAADAAEPGARLRVFGYPGSPARETGMWVEVDLKGEVGGLMIQAESRSDQSVKAQPGYSGSPVWDHSRGEAVGLLHAAPFADEPERDAYLLRPLAVAEAWEQQFDYLLVPENPYRGLEPFTAEHAPVFFGRDTDIAALTALVRDQPVVVVVGPSGVGKSSLVQAGLIPALQRRQRWSVALVRPGQDPWLRLAAGLLHAHNGPEAQVTLEQSRCESDRLHADGFAPLARFLRSEDRPLLVVVDQLEECWPLTDTRIKTCSTCCFRSPMTSRPRRGSS